MANEDLAIARQMFAQSVFTHKVQEVACEFKEKKASKFKYLHLILVAAVIIIMALQAIHLENPTFSYVGIGVSALEIILQIIQLSYDFEKKAALHKGSALKYMDLRDKYLLLIADIMKGNSKPLEITSRRDLLQHQYQTVSELAPQTGAAEYMEAQKRLNKGEVVEGEQFTWSDAEIDRFLPKNLRFTV